MMDGRVKTLHPGDCTAASSRVAIVPTIWRRSSAHGIGLVDLVVVNLYPFAKTATKPGVAFDELVEQIDIGGPSLVRAAAKNFRDVLVVVDPVDYARLLEAIDATPGVAFRFELMREGVRAHGGVRHRDHRDRWPPGSVDGERCRARATTPTPSATPTRRRRRSRRLALEKIRDLRYGENPHQKAAWYATAGRTSPASVVSGFSRTTILQGKELSYTNLLDLDAAARIALEFDRAGRRRRSSTPTRAARRPATRWPTPTFARARPTASSAFGGIVALNRPIDAATAEAIVSTFIEAVIAPSVDAPARRGAGAQGEHARRDGRLRGASGAAASSSDRSSAPC